MITILYKKLLELIQKMNIEKEMEEKFGKDYKRKLLKLTDEEVKEILSLETSKLVLFQIYMFFNKGRLSKEIYLTLNFKLIEHSENVYDLIPLLENDEFLNRKDAFIIIDKMLQGNSASFEAISELIFNPDIYFSLEILEKIASCKETYQANVLKDIAIHFSNRKDILNILHIISTSKGEVQAQKVRDLILNSDILNKDNRVVIGVLRAICESIYDYQAENAYLVAINEDVLNHSDAVRLVKYVSKTEGIDRCSQVKDVALNKNILKCSNAVEFVKIVAESNKKLSSFVAQASIKLCNLREKSPLTIVTIISNAIGEVQANKALELISNETFLQRYNIIPILELIVSTNGKEQIECAVEIAKTLEVTNLENYIRLILNSSSSKKALLIRNLLENKEFLNNPQHFKILERINNSKTDEIAQKAYDLINNPLVFNHPDLFDIVSIITSVELDFQAYFILNSIDKNLLELPHYLEILKQIGKAKGNKQAEIACKIADNYLFVQSQKHLEYITLFAQANDNSPYLHSVYNLCITIFEDNQDILDSEGISYVKGLLSVDMIKVNQVKELCTLFKGKTLLEEIAKIINLEVKNEESLEMVPLEEVLNGSIDEVLTSLNGLSNDEDITPKTFVLMQRKDDFQN